MYILFDTMRPTQTFAQRYLLQTELGTGAFGRTWLAQDLLRGKQNCAVKVWHDVKQAKQLKQEAQLLQQLYHPHVVEVLDWGHDEANTPYLVTEYIDGKGLISTASKLSDTALWDLIGQLCRGLSYIHAQGVVHGDLKPDNILITAKTKQVKLIDFGLATLTKNQQKASAGTLTYMAPEVVAQGKRSKKSDLYALGLIIYQLLYKGQLPFALSTSAILNFHHDNQLDLSGLSRHPWRDTLSTLLQSLLHKQPSKRPQDALEILTTLNKKEKLKLAVHREAVISTEENIFFQDVSTYLQSTAASLAVHNASTPQSFLTAEAKRIEKYLGLSKNLKTPAAQDLRAQLHEAQARILIQQGKYTAALKIKNTAPRVQNVLGLAEIYLNQYKAANKRLKYIQKNAQHKVDQARALNYLGIAAYNQSRFKEAAQLFQQSQRDMKSCKETAGIVSNAMNLGAIAQQQGEIIQALKYYKAALSAAESLQNTYLLTILLANLANLYLQLGALKEADKYLQRTEDLSGSLHFTFIQGYTQLLQADRAQWQEDFKAADQHLTQAITHFIAGKLTSYEGLAWAHYAENAWLQQDWPQLKIRLNQAKKQVGPKALPDTRFRVSWLQIMLELQTKAIPAQAPKTLVDLQKKAHGKRQQFAAASALATWALKSQDHATATNCLQQLQDIYTSDCEAIPLNHREELAQSPRYRALWDLQKQLKQHSGADHNTLKELVRINQRLANQQQTQELYPTILDAAIDLTQAERGFLITPKNKSSRKQDWEVQCARAFKKQELPGGSDLLSQTIIKRLVRAKQAIIIQDAMDAKGLAKFESVQNLKLRSIMATPIVAHGEWLGILYVDHCKTGALFQETDLELLKALADQSAIALHQTQLYTAALTQQAELSAAHQRVSELNQQLQEALAKESDRAERIEQELRKAQAVGSIIARSPIMQRLIQQLPSHAQQRHALVLTGEVGTGKDLLVKELHQQSSSSHLSSKLAQQFPAWRQEAPQTGLMDQLFEHMQGGTLYIDGIEDLALPYQRDLLAWLRYLEKNPDHNTFVILSSRMGLKEGRERGLLSLELNRFLSGRELKLPALRDRKEDINPLAHHFLKELRQQEGMNRRINRRALALFHDYDWPGNVRELKLEVERAALSSQGAINPNHLSPHLLETSGYIPGLAKRDSADIQDKRAQFERDLIMQALEKTGWNKARAAKQLGLSRAMLYIKIKKYEIPLQ